MHSINITLELITSPSSPPSQGGERGEVFRGLSTIPYWLLTRNPLKLNENSPIHQDKERGNGHATT